MEEHAAGATAELEVAAETLPEHLELNHYVEIYRRSAERGRYIVLTVMVFSVVMLVAQWNTTDDSWTYKRYRRLVDLYEDTRSKAEGRADVVIQQETMGRYKSREELKHMLDEYRRARVERVYLFEVPGMGIALDVNDLGLFSGVAYTLLLLLLLFAVMREYENLYLALFKVRKLHDRGTSQGGESTANYLYHALAMSQVFHAPPTLAQWRQSKAKRNVPHIVFITPVLVQAYIVYTNYKTQYVLQWHKRLLADEMIPQYVFLLLVACLAITSAIYADAANYRWRSAFEHINPGLKRVAPIPWTTWVRLRLFRKRFSDQLERRMWAQVVQKLGVTTDRVTGIVPVSHSIELEEKNISFAEIKTMCSMLRQQASEIADRECDSYHFIRAAIVSSVLHDRVWKVRARFFISCTWKDDE